MRSLSSLVSFEEVWELVKLRCAAKSHSPEQWLQVRRVVMVSQEDVKAIVKQLNKGRKS